MGGARLTYRKLDDLELLVAVEVQRAVGGDERGHGGQCDHSKEDRSHACTW